MSNKGYVYVGSNSQNSNAFFVKKKLVEKYLSKLLVNSDAESSTFRESRDSKGNLNFIRGEGRLSVIKELNLFDLNTRKSIRDSVLPLINDSYYDQKHFLVGNPNGKNKVVIFSDPNCPFCINYVPDVIKYIKENTQDTALYYYHYPIETIHPMSVVIIKAMLVAQMQGV